MRILSLATLALIVSAPCQAGRKDGLKTGNVELKAAGSLAFGPSGILFIADPQEGRIHAVDTEDADRDAKSAQVNIDGIDKKIAAMLGTQANDILINDLAANPESGRVYLSVSRGRGPDANAVILRVDGSGVKEFVLQNVATSSIALPNPPEDKVVGQGRRRRNRRRESITDLAWWDGRVIVAGLSNEEFASNLRAIPFPFDKANAGSSVEVYHGAHGNLETRSPVRTFTPFNIGGEPHILAAYTCTPLVKFPVAELAPGSLVRGTTVAELGNRNRPLDMVAYEKDGKNFLLLANDRRGVMKISTSDLERKDGITEPVRGGNTAGQKYDTIDDLQGVMQLDKLNDGHAVLLVQNDAGAKLQTIAFP